jgi:hypothetical protein
MSGKMASVNPYIASATEDLEEAPSEYWIFTSKCICLFYGFEFRYKEYNGFKQKNLLSITWFSQPLGFTQQELYAHLMEETWSME